MKNRFSMCAAAVALSAVSWPASALTIGDIEVKSSYGERFSARVPLLLAAGDEVLIGCVRLEDGGGKSAGVPMLANYQLALEPVRGGKSAVLISTTNALTEPAVRIDLAVRCLRISTSREFIINQNLADIRKK